MGKASRRKQNREMNQGPESPGRRRLLGYIVGTTALVAAGGLGYLLTTSSTDDFQLKYKIDQVRAGKVSPERYVDQLYDLPEVKAAQEAGYFRGFLYDPSDDEIKHRISEVLKEKIDDKKFYEELVEYALIGYRKSMEKHSTVLTTTPANMSIIGMPIQRYVILKKTAFLDVEEDSDFEILIQHELQHVKDEFLGIFLDGMRITHEEFSSGLIRTNFYSHLAEMRASYRSLEYFLENSEEGKVSLTEWIAMEAGNYHDHKKFLEKYPVNDFERRAREAQFKESRGILTEEDEYGDITVRLDLSKKGSFKINRI